MFRALSSPSCVHFSSLNVLPASPFKGSGIIRGHGGSPYARTTLFSHNQGNLDCITQLVRRHTTDERLVSTTYKTHQDDPRSIEEGQVLRLKRFNPDDIKTLSHPDDTKDHQTKLHTLLHGLKREALQEPVSFSTLMNKLYACFECATQSHSLRVREYVFNLYQAPDKDIYPNGSLLHEAVFCYDVKICAFLLERRVVDPNRLNKDGQSPLHLAAKMTFAEMIKLLIQNGAKITLPDSNQNTPLFHAVLKGDLETATLLLATKGEAPYDKAKIDKPLKLASALKQEAMVHILEHYKAKMEE